MKSTKPCEPGKLTAPQAGALALLCGAAGWALDNGYSLPRKPGYSRVVGGDRLKIPVLPIYAAGGAAVIVAAPHLRERSVAERFVAYAAGLTALEYAACNIERSQGHQSWDYEGKCVDLPHALAWGALGMIAEQVSERVAGCRR